MTSPFFTLRQARSLVGRATSPEKLRGQVYTPLKVARAMLEPMAWPRRGERLLDPACGEGVFLEAALRALAHARLPPDRARERIAGMHGWDIDPDALETCRERLARVSQELGFEGGVPRLEQRDALVDDGERFHCVVGNPPYLEAKRMPRPIKRHVRARCPLAARGSFDLYSAFVERGIGALAPGGELCFIVPNRILVAYYAGALREALLEQGAVRVVDLSTCGVFEDAAVYPVILYFHQGAPRRYAVAPWGGSGEPVEVPVDAIRDRVAGMFPLPPRRAAGRALLERVLVEPRFQPLSQVFQVRWTVSFHRAGLRDTFVFRHRPEESENRARPFLGGGRFRGNREVEPFRIRWRGWWIDYDEDRARSVRNALPPLERFQPPKVVVCQNARRCRAALDREGYVLKDTFLSVRCRDPEAERQAWPEWLTLVLNGRLFHYLYEHLYGGTRKGGGFLHFLARYLHPFPLAPPPDLDLVRDLHARAEQGTLPEAERDAVVEAAWGLSPAETRALEGHPLPPP